MSDFDPNGIGVPNGNYYGLPYKVEESDIVLLSVPWDVTVSYGAGTAAGPQAIIDASVQVDLFDEGVPQAWTVKIGTVPVEETIHKLNKKTRKLAENVMDELAAGADPLTVEPLVCKVNDASSAVNEYVYTLSGEYLNKNKLVGLVGGEHSVPLGLVKALGEKYESFGILHVDAHADLRRKYEGFTYSHASIMYNVLQEVPRVTRICQVGVRDFCSDEYHLMTTESHIRTFTDRELHARKFGGDSWKNICEDIIASLPDNVYISFDIDGLSPDLCPSTGTPVPGGLTFREADYLLETLARSGKRIIGFDLCEVAPGQTDEWDANVGARLLFKLCLYANESGKK